MVQVEERPGQVGARHAIVVSNPLCPYHSRPRSVSWRGVGEVAEWSTKSPGAILDSEAGPQRASAEGESHG